MTIKNNFFDICQLYMKNAVFREISEILLKFLFQSVIL